MSKTVCVNCGRDGGPGACCHIAARYAAALNEIAKAPCLAEWDHGPSAGPCEMCITCLARAALLPAQPFDPFDAIIQKRYGKPVEHVEDDYGPELGGDR